MIIEFAGDFIETGESMEQRQSHLNAACTAWNIANLPKYERRKALEECGGFDERLNRRGEEKELIQRLRRIARLQPAGI